MVIRCPRCKFSATHAAPTRVSQEHPPLCPRCRTVIPLPGQDNDLLSLPTENTVAHLKLLPWEMRTTWLDLPAFWKTSLNILFKPTAAFTAMDYEAGIRNSLVYAIVYGSLGHVIGSFWFTILGIQYGMLKGDVVENTSRFAQQILLTPVILVFTLFLAAALVHLGLRILGGARRSIAATFQVMAYVSGATSLVNIIPILGGLLIPAFTVALCCIGLATAHNTSKTRTFFALLLPLVLIIFFVTSGLLLIAVLGMMELLQFMQPYI